MGQTLTSGNISPVNSNLEETAFILRTRRSNRKDVREGLGSRWIDDRYFGVQRNVHNAYICAQDESSFHLNYL